MKLEETKWVLEYLATEVLLVNMAVYYLNRLIFFAWVVFFSFESVRPNEYIWMLKTKQSKRKRKHRNCCGTRHTNSHKTGFFYVFFLGGGVFFLNLGKRQCLNMERTLTNSRHSSKSWWVSEKFYRGGGGSSLPLSVSLSLKKIVKIIKY